MISFSLPPLREELAIAAGPRLADGQPSWTLHDPVRNLFFQIDWPNFELLSRWHLRDPRALLAQTGRETTLHLDGAALDDLLRFLNENQLLQPAPGMAPLLADARRKRRGSWAQWLLHNYLFLRIPLFKPDRWLAWLLPHVAFLLTRNFLRWTVLAGLTGLVCVYREWERFSSTLMDTLTWQGMLAYGVAIVFAKACHELGHALTAKHYGCRVPTMGVAFLVLFPMAYTDTNEAWKLPRHTQRLAIAGAGIATELAIAAWATLAWAWLPEGAPRQMAFLLSTTTWISTLAINASPFMRFDGYFLLSDWLGMPNLHSRAFALARWDLRERMFALNEPVPEHFPRHRHNSLILFAWGVWLYRLVLFLGIAALVYHFFIKAVGILLFAVEIGWFIALPLMHELQAWRTRWPAIKAGRRARRSLLLVALLGALCLVPWPGRIFGAGLLQPREQMTLYAPPRAMLEAAPPPDGSRMAAGQPLLRMTSPDLDLRNAATGARAGTLSWQSAAAGLDAGMRKDWQVLDEKLAYARAEQSTVQADAGRYAPLAPYAGTLVDADPDLRPGDWLKNQEPLGELISDERWHVVTYVDEDDVQRVRQGDRGLFIADGLAGPAVRLTVAAIDRDASRTLNEPELAALFGGHVLVHEKNGLFYPDRAVYRVVLEVEGEKPVALRVLRGRIAIAGAWEAPALRYVRSALAVVWREAGF
ncbi:MAG: HlyD family efflux transporter periplasmic adaptor subunit [Burkholderiaceae bacterium]|nr:HlyD family efflux transporter periplasmic adaptor subunit [Burkholderiaceae bacterium]